MYTEYEEERRFPLRAVLFKMVIIIILIMLLIWILPTSLFNGGVKVLKDNARKMENAALSYYTKDRLPKEENKEEKLTLKAMQDLKLIGKVNYNKKSCDADESYTGIKKLSNDYLLTTHLKCSKEEKTVKSVVGKYDYCSSDLCVKDDSLDKTNLPSCSLEVNKGELGVYDWYRSKVVVSFKSKKAKSGAKIKSYGLSNKNKVVYNYEDKYTIKKDGTIKIYGFVKDNNGRANTCSVTIMKDTKKPTCELSVLTGTKNNDGSYSDNVVVGFKKKEDKLSGIDIYGISDTKEALYNEDSKMTIIENGNYTIYGHVKDKAGNTNTCQMSIKKTASTKVFTDNTKPINNGSNIVINNNTYNTTNNSSSKQSIKPLTCSLKVYKGSKGSDGIYTGNVIISFKNITTHGTKVVGYGLGKSVTYSKNSSYTITDNGTHVVYGYVKDNKGNTAKCSITINKNSTDNSYEYSKYITPVYTSWGAWKELEYNQNKPPVFVKNATKEVEDLGKKTKETYEYSVGSSIQLSKFNEVKTLTEQVCKGYDYYRVSSVTYAVKNSDDWTYVGLVKNNSVPVENVGTKYEYDHLDWNCESCTTPNIIWRKYTRKYYTVSGKVLKDGNSSITCGDTVNGKVIVANVYRKIVGYSQTRKINTTYVYKYRYRTRSLLKDGYTDYKYSSSNKDARLINDGYKLTGKVIKK